MLHRSGEKNMSYFLNLEIISKEKALSQIFRLLF